MVRVYLSIKSPIQIQLEEVNKNQVSSTEEQLKAKTFLETQLNNEERNYVIALNLVSDVPNWLAQSMHFPCISV